ncbi:hypothetical protein FACS1894199_06370 [Bacteroidia bacterium]|nr:hypothetical protein FACS1894199_06370 [Bacteroidia bacterium]
MNDKNVNRNTQDGVSVIITVNDKAGIIKENLEYFLDQDYPNYEVIIVDECSEDDTQDVLTDMQRKYPHLKTTRIFPGAIFRSTKKLAINLGVVAAQYDIILFSEITCRPATRNWIKTMAGYFTGKTVAVIGYANYATLRGLDFPRMFRFMHYIETFFLVRAKCYVAGEGFNMGFRKQHFLADNIFSNNAQTYSGYDSKIVKAISKHGSVRVVRDTEGNIQIGDFARQVWTDGMAYYYHDKRAWTFLPFFFANWQRIVRWAVYVLSLYMLSNELFVPYNVAIIGFTFITNVIVMNISRKHIKQTSLIFTSLFFCLLGFIPRWYYSFHSVLTHKKWR